MAMIRKTLIFIALSAHLLQAMLTTVPVIKAYQAPPALIRVPQDMDLQTAINRIADGGVIEIAAGTYPSPNGGFIISDLGKSFTIRAAQGATVTLDGGNSREIFTFVNSSIDIERGGTVTFENLTFANGKASIDGRAGGFTLQRAQARFVRCTFRNNKGDQPSTGGGGVLVAIGSKATFEDCTWDGNTAKNFGGGLAVNDRSEARIYNSRFINNRTNITGHTQTAAGGAIHVGNSYLLVQRSWFEANQAGYVGGAVYAIGNWGTQTIVTIGSSTFLNNKAVPAYSLPWPTEGGAFHAEDQSQAVIFDSQFANNEAMTGGAVSLYRAVVDISASIFQNNKATGIGAANGFGGAISAISNDTPADGNTNYRPAQLIIRDSVITGTLSGNGQSGGGIYVAGDGNRAYGLNGVPQQGTLADNRARATLERVIIFNTYVRGTNAPGTGIGSGIMIDLADLSVKESMLISNEASGPNSSGGGIAIINNSIARLERVTLGYNRVGQYGGGIFVQGSTIQANDGALFGNQVISNTIYGSGVFAAPDEGRNIDAAGVISGCIVSNNVGLPIFDDDRDIQNGPINDVHYNANQIYLPGGSSYAYRLIEIA